VVPSFRFVVVDVFTDRPLAGNQLAVFTDARELDAETMQALALEVGFSETAFVLPPADGGHARIRIFNPRHEMDFAGHPTLGTAFVLGTPLQLGAISLETGAGAVEVTLERDDSGRIVFGRMLQPVPEVRPFAQDDAVLAALGVARSELPVEIYDNGATHVFVALGSEDEVAALAPDTAKISAFAVTGVNCFAGKGDRWKMRMFWRLGEDAATGSAAGPLACYLARHGLVEWGTEIVISQGAEIDRPSTLFARADGGAGGIERVTCGGSAVVVARGEFRLT
jgi:trans-2,3-dihydro-3-hydroxyanthranilate isomerase